MARAKVLRSGDQLWIIDGLTDPLVRGDRRIILGSDEQAAIRMLHMEFGFDRPSSFGGEDHWNCGRCTTDDDGRRSMVII